MKTNFNAYKEPMANLGVSRWGQVAAVIVLLLGFGVSWAAARYETRVPGMDDLHAQSHFEGWSAFEALFSSPRAVHNAELVAKEHFSSAQILQDHFAGRGYDLKAVIKGDAVVPRLYVDYLPQDLAAVASVERRKQTFVKIILPHILTENERLLRLRERILALRDDARMGRGLDEDGQAFLAAVAREFQVKDPTDFRALLERVDVVPVSLALGQAAVESGWGTSRLARQGNSLFGQMGWKRSEAGGREFALIGFNDLSHTVSAYMRNLNTHWAYKDFRAVRAQQRQFNQPFDSYAMIATMDRYSELGEVYIRKVSTVIRSNRLTAFDGARLDIPVPAGRLVAQNY